MLQVNQELSVPEVGVTLPMFFASFRRTVGSVTKNVDGTYTVSALCKVYASLDCYNNEENSLPAERTSPVVEKHMEFVYTMEELNGTGIFVLLYDRLKAQWPNSVDVGNGGN